MYICDFWTDFFFRKTGFDSRKNFCFKKRALTIDKLKVQFVAEYLACFYKMNIKNFENSTSIIPNFF